MHDKCSEMMGVGLGDVVIHHPGLEVVAASPSGILWVKLPLLSPSATSTQHMKERQAVVVSRKIYHRLWSSYH